MKKVEFHFALEEFQAKVKDFYLIVFKKLKFLKMLK